jgi:DNA-binding transcriptional MocR family regulator
MTINFFKGHPTKRLFPAKQIGESYTKVLSRSYDEYDNDGDNQHPLAYGTDPGNLEVRKSIGKWNGDFYGRKVDPDAINLTAGASYGIANILSACTSHDITKQAFIVTPTYFLINGAFIDAGFEGKLTAIDECGNNPTCTSKYDIDLEYLESKLIHFSKGIPPNYSSIVEDPERGKWKLYRFVIYIVPTFSNPGGMVYSIETRTKLIELARKYDMLIVSDDVYDMLNYGTVSKPIPKLIHLDIDSNPTPYGNVISNCTFSKIIAPGLRLGWQETANKLLASQLSCTGANKSGGTPGQLASLVVQDLIDTGEIDTIIGNFKSIYKIRSEALVKAAREALPPSTKIHGSYGGYFFWITIPGDIDHDHVVEELSKNGVILASGKHFEVLGDERSWGKNSVRLCVSYLETADIVAGIEKWGQVLRQTYPNLYN